MKIALIGMPGSGKTAVAEGLQDATGSARIVDGYAAMAERDIDLVAGLDGGGYLFNIACAMKRIELERRAAKTDHVITCGTLLETSVYTALEYELMGEFTDRQESVDEARRVEATLKMLACLYMDTFKYDAVFYLPPVAEPEESRWQLFDRNLRVAFEAFFLVPVFPLIVETDNFEEAVAKRVEIVATIMKGERTVESLSEGRGLQAQASDGR
jgi:Trp operon repressor